jgi:hypothetical protein
MFKTKKIIITGLILLPIIFILLIGNFTLVTFDRNNIIKTGKNDVETNNLLSKYNKPDYVICDKNLLNPEIIFYGEKPDLQNNYFIIYSKYSRNNVLSYDWKIENNGGGSFFNTDITQVRKILTSNTCANLRKSQTLEGITFTYNPPLTQEQIQAQIDAPQKAIKETIAREEEYKKYNIKEKVLWIADDCPALYKQITGKEVALEGNEIPVYGLNMPARIAFDFCAPKYKEFIKSKNLPKELEIRLLETGK